MDRTKRSQKPWAIYLWPGLPQLWLTGSWYGLFAALVFALMLDLALAGSLVWSELLPSEIRNILWITVLASWASAAAYTARWHPGILSASGASAPDGMFSRALEQYLRGNWFETERMLAEMLRNSPQDPEARLLLATLLRHTGRLDEASRQLRELGKLEAANRLAMEISRERRALAEARTESGADEGQATGGPRQRNGGSPDLQHAA